MAGETERAALLAHLATGVTTLCRCWSVARRDGAAWGFTDHDRELVFDGKIFRPQAGLEASALMQTTGLSVDNAEGLGVLSDASIREEDILAGRFDGAVVRLWLVNWVDVGARMLRFQGTIGEIRRAGGGFRAELRGLTEALNQPQGRVYQRHCSRRLGDARCGVDLGAPGLSVTLASGEVVGRRVFRFAGLGGFAAGWFARGRLSVTSGAGTGLTGIVKADRMVGELREIELWEELRAAVVAGDQIALEPGCDRRAETCRDKFDNLLNFRGFPHIPGEDWMMSYPTQGGQGGLSQSYYRPAQTEGGA